MNGADRPPGDAEIDALAQAHHAIAAAQDRSYWLDRWGIDLNAAMRRPSGRRVREAVRVARSVRRAAIEARRAAVAQVGEVRAIGLDEGDADIGPAPRGVAVRRLRTAPATDALFSRLEERDVLEVERAADVKHSTQLTEADPDARRRLLLALGVQWEIAGVCERTGLAPASPPDGLLAPEPWLDAAPGPLYGADAVADGLATAGIDLAEGARLLDFDCRAGAVARTLAAAYPACAIHACDGSADAVAWARDAGGAVTYAPRGDAPPLDRPDGELDAAYALVAWTRFGASQAREWLAELHRVVRPGGALALVARGRHSVARAYEGRYGDARQLEEIDSALSQDGFWRGALTVEADGSERPSAGAAERPSAFLTPEWLLAEATPQWSVAELAPGRVDHDRDLYVLVRR